jgi:hypothetical protein
MRQRSIAELEAAATLARRENMAAAWTVLQAAKDFGDAEVQQSALAVIDSLLCGRPPRRADAQTVERYFC